MGRWLSGVVGWVVFVKFKDQSKLGVGKQISKNIKHDERG